MGKTKERYTVEEVAEMLKINRTAAMVLLAAVRKDFDPEHVKKIRTRELEMMYQLVKPPGPGRTKPV